MGECGQKTKFLEESVKGDIEISLDFNVCFSFPINIRASFSINR